MNSVRCLFLWIVVLCCETYSIDDELLSSSTVDLASVLRHNLLTNNDDFTPARPAPGRAPGDPAPRRRSQYLPDVDMMDVIRGITGRAASSPDGIQYPRRDGDPTIHKSANRSKIGKFKRIFKVRKHVKSNQTGLNDRRRKLDISNNTRHQNRKSKYLQPNKLIMDDSQESLPYTFEIFKQTTVTRSKITTKTLSTPYVIRSTTTAAPKYHRSETKRPPPAEAVSRARTDKVTTSRWTKSVDDLSRDAWLRSVGPAYKFTTKNDLVNDPLNLMAYYHPFTGKKFEDMQEFMATKFFEFQMQHKEKMGQLVPLRHPTTTQASRSTEEDDSREPPNAQLLDLAPAKGSHIHLGRRQHRVCDRNVLVPEGPKYDRGGRVYLEPYNGTLDFSVTRAPKYIVPRCCNCCKKSVLGCE